MNLKPPLTFTMRVTRQFLEELDALRINEADLPCRSEMLRRLVDRGFVDKYVEASPQPQGKTHDVI